jgi:membrane fusion protein (multidrug efflux system)
VIESKLENGKSSLEVRQQFVKPGRARGDMIAIETGLKPGEKVVSSGVFKLRNKMAVVENNELAPKTLEAPKPSDS